MVQFEMLRLVVLQSKKKMTGLCLFCHTAFSKWVNYKQKIFLLYVCFFEYIFGGREGKCAEKVSTLFVHINIYKWAYFLNDTLFFLYVSFFFFAQRLSKITCLFLESTLFLVWEQTLILIHPPQLSPLFFLHSTKTIPKQDNLFWNMVQIFIHCFVGKCKQSRLVLLNWSLILWLKQKGLYLSYCIFFVSLFVDFLLQNAEDRCRKTLRHNTSLLLLFIHMFDDIIPPPNVNRD